MNYYDFLLPDLEIAGEEISLCIPALKGKKLLITGATGFFGQWLIYFLIFLNKKYALKLEIFCISRNPDLFLIKHPFIKSQNCIRWANVNLRQEFDLEFSPDFVFHMAADVPVGKASQPSESFDAITMGMKNILNFLAKKKKKAKLILTSSGAVYGKQPAEISQIEENFSGATAPLPPSDYYAEAKRVCELMCSKHSKENVDFEFVIARCFAFSGPFIAQDKNYAIGNFVADITNKRDIVVLGNGQTKRSYMYGADLVLWLLRLVIEGKSGEVYNVGSNMAISIGELAKKIAGFGSEVKVDTRKPIMPEDILEQYVPSIEKAKTLHGLSLKFSLEYGIKRMLDFNLQFNTTDK